MPIKCTFECIDSRCSSNRNLK